MCPDREKGQSLSEIALRAENLSKLFRIGAYRGYRTLREHIVERLAFLHRSPQEGARENTIWALKDVSFEVKRGEVVGIVGRNGSGKSTALKILSRIIEPTAGRAELYGRVSSLLEVGTGFHGELSGRENIYLNGAILGMRKPEIDRKFDQIVAFSETEKFIDTPVKHYSTGMQMRLAFAVAAHLETEIMIIDEVLAVGDLSFQNKCLGKMQDVASDGRTVLFVSHNMGAVANLCTSALWLGEGKVVMRGPVQDTIAAYMQSVGGQLQSDPSRWRHRGTEEGRIIDARIVDKNNEPRTMFAMGDTLVVEFDAEFSRSFASLIMSVQIKRTDTGLGVLDILNTDSGVAFENLGMGKHRFVVELPNCLLYPGSYVVSFFIVVSGKTVDHVQDALMFSMANNGCSKRTSPFLPRFGVFHLPSVWRRA
jgi:lipopolysaccharide transport system ATP-binding protein